MSLHDIWLGDVMPESGVAVAIGRNSYDPPAPVVPVHDVHARSLVMYDSGSPEHSGIISFYSDLIDKWWPTNLRVIPGGSGMQPIVPGAVVSAYSSSNADWAVGTYNPMPSLTEETNVVADAYTVIGGSGMIIVNHGGVYDVAWRFTMRNTDPTSVARRSIYSWLQTISPIDSQTGFVEVTGSRTWMYLRSTGFYDTCESRCIVECLAGDVLQAVIGGAGDRPVTNPPTIIADGTSITVEKLE